MTTIENPITSRSDVERMLNVPLECKTKKLGTLKVRELYLEDIIALTAEIVELLQTLDLSKFSGEPTHKFLLLLMQNDALFTALKKIVATATDRVPEDFNNISVTDWLKIMIAIKKVVNLEEIKELFFQLIPKEELQKHLGKLKSPDGKIPLSVVESQE